MKRAEISSEAARNAVHNQAFLSVAIALIFVAVTCMTLLMVAWSKDSRLAEVENGRFIIEITAASEQGIDPWKCEGIASRGGILAAGGIYASTPSRVENPLTFREVPTVLISPGAARVWGRDPRVGTSVGLDLASVSPELGTTVRRVKTDAYWVPVGGVAESRIPIEALNSSLAITALVDAPLDVCWVRYAPANRDSAWGASSAAMGLTPVIIADFYSVTPGSLTSERLWERYVNLFPPGVAGAVAVALTGVTVALRRREVAVIRIAGVSARDTFAIVALEYAIPLIVVLPIAFMWGCVIATAIGPHSASADGLRAASLYVLATSLIYVAGSSLIAALVSRINPLTALKE